MHWVWICNATPFTYVKTHLSWTEGNAMARLVLLASLVAALFLAVEVLTMFVTLAAEVFSSDLRCFSCLVCRARAPRKKLRTRCSSTLRLAGSLLVRLADFLTFLQPHCNVPRVLMQWDLLQERRVSEKVESLSTSRAPNSTALFRSLCFRSDGDPVYFLVAG